MPEDIEKKRFTLMTLNLRFALADDGKNRWALRKPVFPEMLGELDPDFLCVQEANDLQVADLAAMLPGHGHIGRRDPAPPFWQNNVIFHRRTWACTASDHFFLSPTPDVPSRFRNSRWPRQCTLGIFERATRRLTVADTHFDFDPEIQRLSAGIILERLARRAPTLPTIVTGDFNAKPQSPCLEAFTDPDAGFTSAVAPPYPATAHGFTGSAHGEAIDWILYRGGIGVEKAEVIGSRYQGRYPSDHFPVLARFCFSHKEG